MRAMTLLGICCSVIAVSAASTTVGIGVIAERAITPMAAPFVEEVLVSCVATAGGTEIVTGSGQQHFGCDCVPSDSTIIYYADDGVTSSSADFCRGGTCGRPWFKALPGGYCLSGSGTTVLPCNCAVAVPPSVYKEEQKQ